MIYSAPKDEPFFEPEQPSATTPPPSKKPLKHYLSAELFDGAREILIRHQNQDYRLMITRSGKLILNK